jgi:hypothetical protein
MTRTYIIAAFAGAGLAPKAQTRQDLLTSLSEANEAAIQEHPRVLAINTPCPQVGKPWPLRVAKPFC